MVSCHDCAIEYDRWPDGGCPNCGCAAPADPVVDQTDSRPDGLVDDGGQRRSPARPRRAGR